MNMRMKEEKIGSLLWKFSLPAIIGMLVNALYNIVDRIFVGRGVGAIAIAATTVAFPIMILMMAVAMLIGIGATALISIRLGEQKKDEAEKIAGNAITLLVIFSLLFTGVYFLFADSLLLMFGADQDVLPYARDFTHIIMLGSVFGAIGFGANNFIRAEGNPTIAMLTQLAGTFVNIILNYVFIFKLGLGIKGSALASVIGQALSAALVIAYFYSGKSLLRIRIKYLLNLEFALVGRIMAIGAAPFAMQISFSVQQTILNKTLISLGGELALAAVGIMMSIGTIIIMPVIGISQGAQPLIGYNYGAKEYARVKETLRKGVIAATCYVLVGFAVIYKWTFQIISAFSRNDTALTALTSEALVIFFMLLPFVGFQIMCSNYFQAVGKPVKSMVLSLSRQVLFYIPLLLILPRYFGLQGVWWTSPIADGCSVLLTAVVIFWEMRNLGKEKPSLPTVSK